jgi:hypothetical protein
MKHNSLFIVFIVLALATLACGIQFNLPVVEVKTGPTVTDDISISAPEGNETAEVTLAFGAGRITLNPGAEAALISGTATYNVPDFKPKITTDGSEIRLEQGDLEIGGIPNFNKDIENEWDLQFGATPMNLKINAGAYQADYEFGGLALQELEIADGAAEVDLSFSEPNKIEMDTFRYTTGASTIDLKSLANTNADTIIFQSGAGSYTLDFSGDLKRDVTVRIETGLSTITLVVPEGVDAVVEVDGGLSNVDVNGAWKRLGGEYVLSGEGPTIRFVVKMGAGTLQLEN